MSITVLLFCEMSPLIKSNSDRVKCHDGDMNSVSQLVVLAEKLECKEK